MALIPSLPTIICFFATLLIAASFLLSIATTASPRWASRRAYSNASNPLSYQGLIHRNPFGPCVIALSPPNSLSQADNQTCIAPQNQINVGNSTYSLGWDTPLLCDTLSLTGRLLIAGCVLLGLAFIVSLGLFVFGLLPSTPAPPAEECEPSAAEAVSASGPTIFGWSPSVTFLSFAALLVFLLAIAAAFCIAIAQLLGAWALLTLQLPNARFGRPGTPNFLGAWYADQGLSLAGAAWVCAGFGALFVALAWRMPRGYI